MRNFKSAPLAFCRMVIAGAFWLASKALYGVKFSGLKHDTGKPRTYLAISHKRDLDPIVSLPVLLAHRGWRAWAGDVHFALRSDAFAPGYVAHLLPNPRWLARILHLLAIGPVLRWLGAHPLRHLHIHPAEEWIREQLRLEGDMHVRDVLTPGFIQALATAAREPHTQVEDHLLSQILSWRYHAVLQRHSGPDIFVMPIRRRAEQRAINAVKEQLSDLAAWLWNGGSLYGSPEGRLSPDGSLGHVTAALRRLLHASPPDTCIVPVFINYDFMTTQRLHIFVDLAPAIEHAPELQAHELDDRLRHAWLQSARFTCTQLASSFLMHVGSAFTLNTLAADLEMQAKTLVAAGRHVDRRLLKFRSAHKVATGFIEYAVLHGLVRRVGHDTWQPVPSDAAIHVGPGEVGYDQAPLVYAWNSLQDMLSIEHSFIHSD